MQITNFSVRNYMAVYVMIVIIIVVGLYSYFSMPRESSPNIKIPFVIVTTSYRGVSPQDMETLVTHKLENQIENIENIKEMRSSTKEGVSLISVEFDPSVEIDEAIQKVRDKVNIAKSELPSDADEPSVQEINFSNIPILLVNVSGKYGLVRLKDVAEDLKDKIEQVRGVLSVDMAGGLEREVQVDVDPERLRYHGLAIKDVKEAIEKENVTIPGGSVELGDYKYTIRTPGEFSDPSVIGDLVVKTGRHKPVHVRDVAEVKFGFKEASSLARLGGDDCITLSVTKRTGENIIEVSDAIKRLIEQEKPNLPRTTEVDITADQSEITRSLVDDLENNIISGLILVLGVLLLVMNLKVAIFVAVAVPLSMLITFMVMFALGFSLNMVVLFSLILVLGMLVDNAIVIVENIYRHAEEGASPVRAAIDGASEVTMPVITSTVTTLAVFFPMAFWPGIMGEFMVYLPYTVSIGLASSLFVALVINPTLCATLLTVKAHGKKIHEITDEDLGLFFRWYKRILHLAVKYSVSTMILSFVALAAVMVAYGRLGHGVEFFAKVEPTKIFANIEAPTGSSVTATDHVARLMEAAVAQHGDVEVYVTNVGVSTEQFDFGGASEGPSHKARIAVDFIDRVDRTRSTYVPIELMREAGKKIVGADVKIQEQKMGPPTGAPINIEISGAQFDSIADYSFRLEQMFRQIPGLVDIKNDYSLGRPELVIRIDREKAALWGMRTKDIAQEISNAIQGAKASTYREGKDEYDIRVRLRKDRRDNIEKLKEILIRHEEFTVPLSSFATITTEPGYASIAHINHKTSITVSANVASGLNENMMLQKVKELVARDLPTPPGLRVDYTGQNKDQQEAQDFLGKAFVAGVLMIAFVLVLQFNSLLTPFVILTAVFLSLLGVFIGLMVTATPFGIIMTGVGVISLAGVVVNNSIVLLDYTIQLRERGMEKLSAVVTAGITRVRPVLLTAVTTILGLMPMAVGMSVDFKKLKIITASDSADWWGPMAVAVIFGLAFATMLTLVVAPTMYYLLDTISEKVTGSALTHDGVDQAKFAHKSPKERAKS
ncbi:MAG: efflux RND transporter permease subunit [Nitrospinota bacterium]|nr:efflux RND transporter permease subunit [Nitrospinota bacterium]